MAVRRRAKGSDLQFEWWPSDTVRRSTAVQQLCAFRVRDLITAEEFKSLSPELRERIDNLIRIFNEPREIVYENDDEVNPR